MARGAIARAPIDLAVSITGVAGPGGGSAQKPVGLVYLGVARKDGAARVERRIFAGDRTAVREAALALALALLSGEAQS
jgi:nicotinamide-nucleotide amidase